MKRRPSLTPAALLGAALAALVACADDPAPEPRREPLRVNARSEASVDLSRTSWEACQEGPGTSQRWREDHGENGAVTYAITPYDAPGCTGNAGTAVTIPAVAYVRGERVVGFTGVPPPDVGPSVVATRVEVDAGAAGFGRDCYWLDDVASPRVLYTGDPASTVDAEGYPNLLLEGGEREQ